MAFVEPWGIVGLFVGGLLLGLLVGYLAAGGRFMGGRG
jgi:hypothetical protein